MGSVIELTLQFGQSNKVERSTVEQNRTFHDYRTVDCRSQSDVRLQNSCLFDVYVQILTLIKNEVMKKMPKYHPIIKQVCIYLGSL